MAHDETSAGDETYASDKLRGSVRQLYENLKTLPPGHEWHHDQVLARELLRLEERVRALEELAKR